MALYQAMRATPDRLPKERPKWKALGHCAHGLSVQEDDEELTEEEVRGLFGIRRL